MTQHTPKPPDDDSLELHRPETETRYEEENPRAKPPAPDEEPTDHRDVTPEPDLPVGWTRPQPLQRDSNVRAWLFFLAGLSLVVGLWVPLRATYQRLRYRPDVEGVRDADSFLALAYTGVSAGQVRGPEEISRVQFEEHIRALRENGFNPIGLEDVRAFYQEGRLLPRKAVLVTLEQGRKSSYLETRSILRSQRWRAVMFVRADTIRDKDPGALRWPILRDMARSGMWDIAAESCMGFQRIPAGPDGETGNFFSTPQWLATEQQLETPAEFTARIQGDHEAMLAVFEERLGRKPIAFAYPYGDYGQYDLRAVPIRALNLAEVGKRYGLGFSLGPLLLNTRHTDPRGLNRLLVNPHWSREQFLSIVEGSWARPPWKIPRPLAADRWLTDWGLMEYPAEGGMWLKAVTPGTNAAARPPTTGALAWMVGSDLFGDFNMRIRFRVMAGQFGLRLRARVGGEEGLRILFDAEGNCWVKQKVMGAEEFTQAVAQGVHARPGDMRELLVTLKGRDLVASLDGRPLLKEPLDLLDATQPGLFGLEVWDPTPGTAATRIELLEFPQPRQILMHWPPNEVFTPTYVSQELSRHAHLLSAISPPWLDAVKAMPLVLPEWRDPTLKTLARIHQVSLMPGMTLGSAQLALQIPPQMPAQEAHDKGMDGVFLDCRQVPADDIQTLVPWLQKVDRHLKEYHMKTAIRFPAELTRLTSFAAIAALFPGAILALDSTNQVAELADVVSNAVTAVELAPPGAKEMHLNLYYQLAAKELPDEALSPQARQEAWRRNGYEAYQEGAYDEAIAQWERWLEADPQSAEALSLIGRTYVQKNDQERALEYYTRSLAASPGQIHMAIRRAELLEDLNRPDEAREQLNAYARIFPENPDILIAQAQWLDRRQRRTEARNMLQALVKESPLNLSARLALLNLQEMPRERYETLEGILALGRTPDFQIPFGHSMLGMELLTFPESGVFFEYVRNQARRTSTPKTKALYENFLPLTNRVTDDFAAGQLSDGWIASSGIRQLDRGRYELRTAVDQSETYLRLRRSELMRDGYIEASIDESQGFFWLYARRSSRAMLRFGFDQDGFIHLQAWRNGELEANAIRPWVRPPGSMKMRLEVRGDGLRGFVNGMEIFDAPVEIPSGVAYGWWGVAPFAFDVGVARARISRLDCEPLPATLVLLPPGDSAVQIDHLRPSIGGISALAPVWFFQNPDGTLPDEAPVGADTLRMFSAFHRIRLLPVIDLSYDGDVEPQELAAFIQRHALSGAILKRRTRPTKAWWNALTVALQERPANVLVLQTEAALWNTPRAGEESRGERVIRPVASDHLLPEPGELLGVHEQPIGSVLLPPLRPTWRVPLFGPDDTPPPVGRDLITPRLFLMGPAGQLAPLSPP